MPTSYATVPTPNARLYVGRLCRHWAHKNPVSFDDTQGRIELSDNRIVTLKVLPDALEVHLEMADAARLPRLQEVVAEHLKRFEAAFKETLIFEWK